MEDRPYVFTNRTICSILNEMRSCHKTRNFSALLGLIEEAQSAANRMEAALGSKHDLKTLQDWISKAKKEAKELEKKLKELEAGDYDAD